MMPGAEICLHSPLVVREKAASNLEELGPVGTSERIWIWDGRSGLSDKLGFVFFCGPKRDGCWTPDSLRPGYPFDQQHRKSAWQNF